jgi:hypothetical protein
MLPMPNSDASEIWRECETINQEMESLILSDWPRSHEENQVRKIQFMALVERRSEAARRFLADAAARPRLSSAKDRESRSTDGDDITAKARTVLPADYGPNVTRHVTDDDLTRRMTLLQEYSGL